LSRPLYLSSFPYTTLFRSKLAIRLSAPHTGIGSDGLVLIGSSKIADFSMRIFNADGSEAMMCGNASRCIGKYVYDKRLTDKKNVDRKSTRLNSSHVSISYA